MHQNSIIQSNQTPLGILNHLCSVSRVPMPSFEFEQIQNENTDFYFTCKCYINDEFQSLAKGNKKKTAKHLAAFKILKMLKENSSNSELASKLDLVMKNMEIFAYNQPISLEETNQSLSNNSSILNESDLENFEKADSSKFESIKNDLAKCKNPVGEIMIIADKYSIKQPVFIIEDLCENFASKQFSCEVKFGGLCESACGRTKKLAKRYASIKLLFKMKTSGMLDYCPLKNKSCHQIEINPKTVLYDQLKCSKKKAISIVKSKNFSNYKFSGCALLEQLAKEENFEYEINHIPSNIEDSKACTIYIKSNPQLIFGGYGKNQNDSINNAVYFLFAHLREACTEKDTPISDISC